MLKLDSSSAISLKSWVIVVCIFHSPLEQQKGPQFCVVHEDAYPTGYISIGPCICAYGEILIATWA